MSSVQHRPRRSALYMPGANARALEKAKTISADCLILDLEDAVAPDAKSDARTAVCEAVSAGGYGPREVVIRMNALDTEWGGEDLAAAVKAGPDTILAPKVNHGSDIERLDEALTDASAPKELGLWVMIETPLALLNIAGIAAAGAHTRLSGFVMGTNDLAKDMRASPALGRTLAFGTAFGLTLAAARAYGLIALDGVYNDIKNEAGFAAECREGAAMGFDGKTLIHPSQVAPCNTVFAPSEAAVAQARDVIAAFALPENSGAGVIKVNGKMTEILHLQEAERLVAMDAAITRMTGA